MSTEMVFVFTLIAYVIISAMLRVSLVDIRKRVRILGRVDAKLDLLLKEAGIEFDPYKELAREVADAVQRGQKIQAIKLYRDASGAGLREAKDFIEEFQHHLQTRGDRHDAAGNSKPNSQTS
jgi:ribosomal protein L7/L12